MPANPTGSPSADILVRDGEFQTHLQKLGLNSVVEYAKWCASHGFSTRIEKHWHERSKERYFAAQDEIRDRLSQKRLEKRKPRRVIKGIFDGDVDESKLTQPHLHLIHRTVASIEDHDSKLALRELLLGVEARTAMLTNGHAFPQFGAEDGNTFVFGLLGLAQNRFDWIRPLKAWKPPSHNVRRQFSSLSRHLLADYPVPLFMDSVWFRGQSTESARQQAWFKRLARGESPRRLDLPLQLTKRMARHFLEAPKDSSVDEALRWSQVVGLGGTQRLVRAILGSRIAADFNNNEFWETVIRWFIQHAMLDPAQVGPLIDYIYRRKFEPQGFDAADSDFTMKGRTPASLIHQMREWHARLRKEAEKPQLEWSASGFGFFEWTEGVLASNNLRRWTITELLSRKDLYKEGQVMRHCVASYDNSCIFGGTSIWSMGVERNLGRRKRVLTIEIANAQMRICQVRGKANRRPSEKEMGIVRRWATQERLSLGAYVQA